jgi:hypothetical protein
MNKNIYYIETKIQTGEYEKTSTTLVAADTKKEAQEKALLGECHGSLENKSIEFTGDDAVEDMGGEFIYSIYTCIKVDEEDVETLRKYHRYIH